MNRKVGYLLIALLFVGASAMFASAQDIVPFNFGASELIIDAPNSLEANTQYSFEFTVFNNDDTADPEWVKGVALAMPSADYVVDPTGISVPTPLHPSTTDYWSAGFNPSNQTITWQIYGVVTPTQPGDIRDGESLSFSFVATTDDTPSDGFAWTISGDKGNNVHGFSTIGTDDDDDIIDDDDDTIDDDDDTGDDDDFTDDDDFMDDDDTDDDASDLPGADSSDDDDDSGGCCG